MLSDAQTISVPIQLPPLTEYQHAAFYTDKRLGCIEGSPKCGKTTPAVVWMLSEMVKNGDVGRDFWWLAPVYSQAEIGYRRMVQLLTKADPHKRVWSCSDKPMTVRTVNGSACHFKTSEEPDNLYGHEVYGLVVDESSRVPGAAWDAARSTMTATGGPVRAIGNVRGRKNWHYKLCRRAEAGAPDMHYARMTAKDAIEAGLFPESELDSVREQLPEAVFRELYFCEPSEDGANPFGLQHIARCTHPLAQGPAVCFGVDLARSIDWTVIVGLNSDMQVCYFDRWQGVTWDLTEDKLCNVIQSKPAAVDSSGIGDVVVPRLQQRCGNVEAFPTGSRKQGLIEGLAVDVQQERVKFPEGPIKAEMEQFEYKLSPTLKVQYSAPDGVHDDCVVALALACNKWHNRMANIPSVSFTHAKGERPSPRTWAERRKDHNWGFA